MDHDVLVVGAGVAGLSAATFTSRAGLDTLVVDGGEPILGRNAHLENVPGFPAGVNSRTFLDACRDQTREAGAVFREATVESVDPLEEREGLRVRTDGGAVTARRVVAASWADATYLPDGVDSEDRGGKTFIQADGAGRTGVAGLYAAGRLADRYHQAVVAAGDGARAAITLLHDSDTPFYHDWVVPEGYFTGRGRDVPPGCEEIDEAERRRRERESMAEMQARFADPHPGTPTMHPSVRED
jgi:thioredoxin reductase